MHILSLKSQRQKTYLGNGWGGILESSFPCTSFLWCFLFFYSIFAFSREWSTNFCFWPPQNGLNALHLAAKEGHVDLVQELLDRGSSVVSATKVEFLKKNMNGTCVKVYRDRSYNSSLQIKNGVTLCCALKSMLATL